MGGYGSSRWGSTLTKQYTGACLQLRVAALRPYLMDNVLRFMPWQWTHNDGTTSRIGVQTERECVTLAYTVQRGNEEPRVVQDAVMVEWTPCTFGGERAWFRCPGCDRRVAMLYLPPRCERFRCRHCHSLAYGSQQVVPEQRHLMQIRKIQRRLGGEPTDMFPWAVLEKPKRMHLRTYDRLCEALFDHEMERHAILDVQLTRLIARSDRILARAGIRHDDSE